jgi:hypothetical protein
MHADGGAGIAFVAIVERGRTEIKDDRASSRVRTQPTGGLEALVLDRFCARMTDLPTQPAVP